MSKKLTTALDDCLRLVYPTALDKDISDAHFSDLIKQTIVDRKLLNFTSAEMDRAYVLIVKAYNTLEGKRLQGGLEPEEKKEHFDHSLRMKFLETAIEMRKEARSKKGDHPILHKHVDHPLFSVDRPKNATMQKMLKQNGLFIEKRDGGYRQVYFRNDNGTMLTEYDHRVFSSLCKICVEKGLKKEMRVNLSDLAEEMKIVNPAGGDYKSLRESLLDIYNTTVVFEENMTDDFNVESTSFEFHRIFQAFKASGPKFSTFTVLFQDYIHQALVGGEFFNMNMYLMNDLEKSVTRSLYNFLLNEFSKDEKDSYIFHFSKLRSHIDIDRNNANRANMTIKDGLSELQNKGIIDSFKVSKFGVGEWVYEIEPNLTQLKHVSKNSATPIAALS
ncbi:hypothetical protein J2T17_004419 [Paenibacillus mucilaginosus]|uniref:hypothetical protein n=1 Tax=Paenibacillus mucilaginosus TaxID=61624 RepID=UPI003D20B64D